jgi:hypothetical protein
MSFLKPVAGAATVLVLSLGALVAPLSSPASAAPRDFRTEVRDGGAKLEACKVRTGDEVKVFVRIDNRRGAGRATGYAVAPLERRLRFDVRRGQVSRVKALTTRPGFPVDFALSVGRGGAGVSAPAGSLRAC